MKTFLAGALCGALALYLAISSGSTALAQGKGKAKADVKPTPVRLDPEKIAGLNLTSTGGGGYEEIKIAGELKFRVATLFSGKNLNVSIFESTPATTDHKTRPTEGDEFVHVVSGKLILTEPDGTKHNFPAGESLVLPAGYTGTWEMQGNYREIAITGK